MPQDDQSLRLGPHQVPSPRLPLLRKDESWRSERLGLGADVESYRLSLREVNLRAAPSHATRKSRRPPSRTSATPDGFARRPEPPPSAPPTDSPDAILKSPGCQCQRVLLLQNAAFLIKAGHRFPQLDGV